MINLQRQEATESKHRSPLHIEQKIISEHHNIHLQMGTHTTVVI